MRLCRCFLPFASCLMTICLIASSPQLLNTVQRYKKKSIYANKKAKKQKTLLYISNKEKPKNKFAAFKKMYYLCRPFWGMGRPEGLWEMGMGRCAIGRPDGLWDIGYRISDIG